MRILLVEDHTLVRRGLAELLAVSMEAVEVEEAGDARSALEIIEASPPDVAVVDVRLPGDSGLDLLRRIRSSWPELPVVILSHYDDEEYVRTALAEGAAGYLLKDITPEDLIQALSAAVSGAGNVLSPAAAKSLIQPHRPPGPEEERPAPGRTLTKREREVLSLLAGGLSNREIADRLSLSEKTVKAHLASIFRKLGVPNRVRAAMIGQSLGLGPRPQPQASR